MSTYNDFKEKLQKQEVFFKNTFENAVLRSDPSEKGYYVKFPGEKEFRAKEGSNLVAEAIREHNEITKEQYQKF